GAYEFRDTTAPVFGAFPADINDTTDQTSKVETYTNPTATDATDGPATVTCAPPSGSAFPASPSPGTTTQVSCTATDNHGNSTGAVPASKVTIVQSVANHPPDITVPANIPAEATGPNGAAVTYQASATDPDPGDTVASFGCTPASTSTFPLGPTTVNCHAVDN